MFEKLLAKLGYVPLTTEPRKKAKWSKQAKARVHAKKMYKQNRVEILRKVHQKQKPLLHTDDCPACNPASPMTLDEYIKQTRLMAQKMAVAAKVDKYATQKQVQQSVETPIAILDEGIVPQRYLRTTTRPVHNVEQRPDEPKGGYIQ